MNEIDEDNYNSDDSGIGRRQGRKSSKHMSDLNRYKKKTVI